jgi:hypothetical protein
MGVRESEHPIVLRKAGIATRATLLIGKGVPRPGPVGTDDTGDIELHKRWTEVRQIASVRIQVLRSRMP